MTTQMIACSEGSPHRNFLDTRSKGKTEGTSLSPVPSSAVPSLPAIQKDCRVRNLNEKRLLPKNFQPSPYTVVIGRGKACANATGTKHLKALAQKYLEQYSNARNRQEKSAIVSTIVDKIQELW